jgi:hypothetical protein
VLPVPAETIEVLQNYLRLERPLTNSPSLFVSLKGRQRGQPITPAGLRSLFYAARFSRPIHIGCGTPSERRAPGPVGPGVVPWVRQRGLLYAPCSTPPSLWMQGRVETVGSHGRSFVQPCCTCSWLRTIRQTC